MNEEAMITWNKKVHRLFENEDNIPVELLKPKTTLESINDDCLRYIFQHINIVEVVNVAETCTRLQKFATDCIYPKLAKEIEIRLLARADEYPSWSVDGLFNLKSYFEKIGNFVERLSLVASNNSNYNEFFTMFDFEKILILCPNLHTLCFERVEFDSANILKYATSNLKEIKFIGCSGINWSKSLEALSQNISSFAIDYHSVAEEDFTKFLDLHGTLQQLRLVEFSKFPDFELIVTLVADKLPNLKNLSIEDNLTAKLQNSLSKLPHLKSLKINCLQSDATTLLRTLSDCGTIEDLEITNCVIDDENDTEKLSEEPLIFGQLRNFRCSQCASPMLQALLCLMTKSEMPSINFVSVQCYEKDEHCILKFFESKISVTSMSIQFQHMQDTADTYSSPLLTGIIEIVKADRNRPYLTLQIPSLKIGMEEVSKKKT